MGDCSVPGDKGSSDSAQQPYDWPVSHTFEDMDIFYYRQLAVSLQDPVMQQKLDYELRMRDGAAKLLSAAASAKYSTAQCLDAAKTLIVSSTRMASYVDSLQQQHGKRPASRSCSLNAAESMPPASTPAAQQDSSSDGNQLPSKATVALSEIRIPLMWKDSDHFKNKGTHRRFAVFCVSQIGTAVQETSLIVPIDRTVTDVSFDDCLLMEDIPHDFKCKLSVYAHELCDDLTIASAPVKIRKKINNISNSIGRRLSGTGGMKENVEDAAISGPRFDVVAHAELSLKDCKDNAGIHDLAVNCDSDVASGLPLFGNFCCRIIAQPHSLKKEAIATYLFVKETSEQWQKYWCVLRNLKISCWDTPFEADLQDPILTIPVTKDSLILDADPSFAEKPFTLHIRSVSHVSADRDLAAESADILKQWWAALERHLLDQVVWNHACENLMEIKTPPAPRNYSLARNGGSPYEKMTAKGVGAGCKAVASADNEASPLTLMFNRLTREDGSPRSPVLVRKTSRH